MPRSVTSEQNKEEYFGVYLKSYHENSKNSSILADENTKFFWTSNENSSEK